MPDTKLRPTSKMKSKDKSSEQRFDHLNATNRNSYLNIIFTRATLCVSYCRPASVRLSVRHVGGLYTRLKLSTNFLFGPVAPSLIFLPQSMAVEVGF